MLCDQVDMHLLKQTPEFQKKFGEAGEAPATSEEVPEWRQARDERRAREERERAEACNSA